MRAAIETGQCLNRQYALEFLVHIHGGQLGLVESGKVFVGDYQQAVFVSIKLVFDMFTGEAVDDVFRVFNTVD